MGKALDRPLVRHRASGWCAALMCLGLLGLVQAGEVRPAELQSGMQAGKQSGDRAADQAELQRLRRQIQALRDTLNQSRGRQQALRRELQEAEQAIGSLSRELSRTRRELSALREELQDLRARHQAARRDLERQKELLRRQLLAAYVMGRHSDLKIVLNQEDPAAIGRVLVYYDYLNRARAERIDAVRRGLAEVARLEQRIEAESRRLQALAQTQQRQVAQRRRQHERRRQVLAKLEAQIHTQEQRLARYLEDERRLRRLVEQLAQRYADQLREAMTGTLPEAGEVQPFARLKGRLPWPVAGTLRARFGERRLQGGRLKWQGVLIAAEEGTPVRSIHHGRVVFADWLRGFGLLLIIDHGDGYMSLYGHNQSLYKNVGEWVAAGEIIATVGRSGGRDEPGLYFEIRRQGKPADPLRWCRREAALFK